LSGGFTRLITKKELKVRKTEYLWKTSESSIFPGSRFFRAHVKYNLLPKDGFSRKCPKYCSQHTHNLIKIVGCPTNGGTG
jgi:hypothetical protein